jgi:basic membrane lipoprotein Med (substrate-binding protein (PBP1-ABC) superfamily)
MRAPRWGLAAALVLMAAACGNDPGTGSGAGSESAAPSEAGSAASDAPSEAASGSASEVSSLVPLDQLCSEEYSDVEAPDDFSVGLVTDIGSVDDGTFNQYAFEGMQAAEDCFGIETNFIETQNQADYENNLDTILSDEPDVVVTVGFLLADGTKKFAGDNPDVNFVGVDQFQEDYGENYAGVLFREDQGGYRVQRRRRHRRPGVGAAGGAPGQRLRGRRPGRESRRRRPADLQRVVHRPGQGPLGRRADAG